MDSKPGQKQPVLRFAPSPNGYLHIGHALSAILNFEIAMQLRGRFLLRIEDIDITRCRPEFENAIYDDLRWLGLDWETPVRRQSEHIIHYQTALDQLKAMGVVYPAFLSRSEVKAWVTDYEAQGGQWPRDPDGAPFYPPLCKTIPLSEANARIAAGDRHAWRLDMHKALAFVTEPLTFDEQGAENCGRIPVQADLWGDVMLWRWDAPASYHLAVTLDDALQGVTHVLRGTDLFAATHVHRLLQHLLDLDEPVYHHHRLILDEDGNKLSKSRDSTAISALRAEGITVSALRALIGIG